MIGDFRLEPSDWVLIPGGEFWMGQDDGRDEERPAHRVWVDDFLLCRFQVTNAEYDAFRRATGRPMSKHREQPELSRPDQPVVAVSWFDAQACCDWLAGRLGRSFRLPAEAEWERAARGGLEQKLYPWGDQPVFERENYGQRWRQGPEPVGSSASNGYGLFDMCENVHEWCSDWYDPRYYLGSPPRNPRGPEGGERRASRGGSWRHHIKIARCAARSSIPPQFCYADYGFRVACEARGSGCASLTAEAQRALRSAENILGNSANLCVLGVSAVNRPHSSSRIFRRPGRHEIVYIRDPMFSSPPANKGEAMTTARVHEARRFPTFGEPESNWSPDS